MHGWSCRVDTSLRRIASHILMIEHGILAWVTLRNLGYQMGTFVLLCSLHPLVTCKAFFLPES